jgi:hypothetical protein
MFLFFLYLLLIVLNKFNGYNKVNISFYTIKYLNIHSSLIFFNFSFSYCFFFQIFSKNVSEKKINKKKTILLYLYHPMKQNKKKSEEMIINLFN